MDETAMKLSHLDTSLCCFPPLGADMPELHGEYRYGGDRSLHAHPNEEGGGIGTLSRPEPRVNPFPLDQAQQPLLYPSADLFSALLIFAISPVLFAFTRLIFRVLRFLSSYSLWSYLA